LERSCEQELLVVYQNGPDASKAWQIAG